MKSGRAGDRIGYMSLMIGTIEVFPVPAAQLTVSFPKGKQNRSELTLGNAS